MTKITKWAFHNKAAIGLIVVLVLIFGVVSYLSMPKEFLPSIDQPQVTVTVFDQGMDTQTMTNQVTSPIEQAVATLKGKTDVLSTTSAGVSSVQIGFDASTSMKDAKAEVQDTLSSVTLPSGAQKPFIAQLNTSMIPVADVALTFPSAVTQDQVKTVKNDILPLFQGIAGVQTASLYGEKTNQVLIQVNKTKLAQLHIPVQALTGILQGKNLTTSIGDQTIDNQIASLQVVGQIDTVQSLADLYVVPGVQLKDVATVQVASNDQLVTRVNGKDALVVIVTKGANANAVTVGQKIQQVVTQVNSKFGPTIQSTVAFSTSDQVVNAVNSMTREVLLGALFATIVILLFLRSLRITLVTAVSIPLSLGLTLFLLNRSGITLNILTLGAIAVAVGRLVDDSIVVIENIYRKSQMGGIQNATMIEATREVATAITSSTLTTVAVFLPMGLVQGSLRQMLLPFALTVAYSLLSSLLVALAVVPIMSSGLLKKLKPQPHRRPERYIRVLTWSLNHKWVPLLTAVVIFVASVGAYVSLPKAALDTSNSSIVQVTLTYPSNTPFDKVKSNTIALDAFMSKQTGPKTLITMLGSNAQDAKFGQVKPPTEASFTIVMKSGANADTFIKAVQGQKVNYPGADLSVSTGSFMGGGTAQTIDLFGKDPQTLQTAAKQVMDAVQGIEGVQKVTSNVSDTKPMYQIVVNPERANPQDISMALSSMLNPIPIGSMKLQGTDTPVFIASTNQVQSASDLSNLIVATKTGVVTLGSVATVQKLNTPGTILRKNGNQFVQVSMSIDPKKLSVITKDVQQKTAALHLPSGVTLNMGGASSDQASQFGDLFKTMLASIGLVYLIMVITFKKLRTPLAILFTLPLAAVGAILGLMVTRTPIDVSAMIGALMLIGIVVTNAIVLLDRVRQNEETMTIREALVEGAATRVRPILMTAVATVFALLPLLFGNQEAGSLVSKSLAVVVISGLTVATLLTLVMIPVMYELMHFRLSRKQRKGLA